MKFSIKDFFSKCDQIRSNLRIWSHLLKKSLMENFVFCALYIHLNLGKKPSYKKLYQKCYGDVFLEVSYNWIIF